MQSKQGCAFLSDARPLPVPGPTQYLSYPVIRELSPAVKCPLFSALSENVFSYSAILSNFFKNCKESEKSKGNLDA
jgi:hypothetical protein